MNNPILTIGIFSFLLFQYSKIIEKIILFRNNYIKLSGFWIIFLISLFYKYCIFKFNFYGTYTETIENIFIKNEFNDYKLYNYIAYLFYKISPNHNTYLFLLNNILGSLSLKRSLPTTQIEHYDNLAALFDCMARINTILIDFSRDFNSSLEQK